MQTPFDTMNDLTVQATRNFQSMFFKSLEDIQSSFVESLRNVHAEAVKMHVAPNSMRESAKFEKNLGVLRSTLETQRKAFEAVIAV